MLSVSVKVRSNGDGRGTAEVEALVDTGAIFTLLPRVLLQSLGLEPQGKQAFRTIDGNAIDRDIGVAYLEVQGRRSNIPIPIIFGDPKDIPVLGVTALEILGLQFDPVRGELRPTEFLMLSAFASPEEIV